MVPSGWSTKLEGSSWIEVSRTGLGAPLWIVRMKQLGVLRDQSAFSPQPEPSQYRDKGFYASEVWDVYSALHN